MNVDKLKEVADKDGQVGIYDYGYIEGLKEGLLTGFAICFSLFMVIAFNNMAWISRESQGGAGINKRCAGKIITLTGELAMCIDNNPGDTCSRIYGVKNGNTITFGWSHDKNK